MEQRTIRTRIEYSANESARLSLAKLGLPAMWNQKIYLDLPADTPGITIDSAGQAIMFPHNYKPELSYDYLHDIPEELQGNGRHDDKALPFIYHLKAKSYTGGSDGFDTPIYSVEDVQAHWIEQAERSESIKAAVIAKQAEYDKQYEADIIAQKARIQHLADIADLRKSLETEYQNATSKLEAIGNLIEGKTRVRVQQIRDIIG
jgi:hypothetical protein